jgi:two-component system phosphate regulon sensor histidine kinase PhoR
MNKGKIRLIIILTSITLVGALITQLLWVNDAWQLKRDQFDGKVKIALKSVVNQILTSEELYPEDISGIDSVLFSEHQEILTVVDPHILDSLILEEFAWMRLKDNFHYGVYRNDDSLFVIGNFSGWEEALLDSEHWVSLTCLCESEAYLLSVIFLNQESMILGQMIILPVMSGLFLMVLIFSFFFTIYSLFRQKKLSDIKTDFVNNMTHEFKTPISTISVSSEMLTKEAVVNDPERITKYAGIIYNENLRLKNQVERVLQIAIIDKGEFNLKMKKLDINNIINRCINNFEVVLKDRNGKVCFEPDEGVQYIEADEVHFFNIINNLLDNANKYTPENPKITISTAINKGKIKISISDNGIGISKEDQSHIFKKFHRLQSGDIHDVKGFGLGLYYVKTMVEAMGGTIEIKSEKNKGSRFNIYFSI